MIECVEVSKRFKHSNILNDISLRVENGTITALVGKNGAGKSTLIGAILGYFKIESGEIKKKSISVMPDADSLYTDITGYEFLNFVCKLKKLSSNEEAIYLAKELNLEKDLKKKIEGYSFGMKKKISFIQACIGKYDTYIFDEPTSGVDEPSAIKMLKIVENLKSEGSGILLTSHNLDELERVSDYIYIIENGYIINKGTVEEIVLNSNRTSVHKYILIVDDSYRAALILEELGNIKLKIINQNKIEVEMANDSDQIKNIIYYLLENNISFEEFYKIKNNLRESVYAE
ncbi:ABC transporter ATP-binding protein [Enterococcus faecium]|uniref:ABC transporter ATP-binding protein n=1 Tax=Enterococcus TaxID=1350 RepID=UPI001C8CA9F4|nr:MULTISPECIES: ABC transporter ATP-binding protein [Enterococcus]MBX9119731.1 ABC transporter ATP-binding protein [Enterococcus faecium]MBX9128097.1 ABC transporter ATP-binding protein [Enterococcus casseliflavus]